VVIDSVEDPCPVENRSMGDDQTFVDTNVLVYSYDSDAGPKHTTARSIIVALWRSRPGTASTLVKAKG
jgi:predicted nucleic acid-binding protein